MIEVTIVRKAKDEFTRLTIVGHAKYADLGEDIVCAGVSALAQTSVLGLRQVVGIAPLVTLKNGFMSLELPPKLSGPSQELAMCLVETLCLGLEDIAKSYPSHVSVRTVKEVC